MPQMIVTRAHAPAKKKRRSAKKKTTRRPKASAARRTKKKSTARKSAKRKSAKKRGRKSAKKRAKPGARALLTSLTRRLARCEGRLTRALGRAAPARPSRRSGARGSVASSRSSRSAPTDTLSALREALAEGDLPRFGPHKVFLGPLAQRMAIPLGTSAAAVKDELVALHRAGRVHLSRADLTSAMDPALVRSSETPLMLGGRELATFHFLND